MWLMLTRMKVEGLMQLYLGFFVLTFRLQRAPLFFSQLAYQDWHMGSVILACNEGSLREILLLLLFPSCLERKYGHGIRPADNT